MRPSPLLFTPAWEAAVALLRQPRTERRLTQEEPAERLQEPQDLCQYV